MFKSLNKLNSAFINDIFEERNISKDLRDGNIMGQPIFSKLSMQKILLVIIESTFGIFCQIM